ncbi:hypothetical protein KAM429_33730 [Aquipseudomonas alcaligenes]|uniref:Aminopeptidase n=1 Tax=Aquipseudomonas alcaligenes TaxID=43263 RepID=A0AA37CI33_AQUAC|nr:hypothetical protein KAM426_01140 [Pseudomonas alcaligenes]GIZ68097.1 hypothetical protein KAM428_31820 [Pseudomonas alcaligenes]GIZ72612.1 hypothetical protein KAM429_33730 [Pseudomonas alcaligenes]GIZ76963.1 hypothetical protein KAM430_33720 [Pseudomonas alcaligenes]GIZ81095.1 hypothetical protein KAM432_31430 [Pseudomonas alcaligenes]
MLCGVLLNGCASLDYYAQVSRGQLDLLAARQPVAELLAAPHTDPELKWRLALAQQARSFASAELGLPDNRSYRLYADLQRPYVVWNVFATPELSLQPLTHCFPIAGCVAYRGYYQQGRARGAAALLQAEGSTPMWPASRPTRPWAGSPTPSSTPCCAGTTSAWPR